MMNSSNNSNSNSHQQQMKRLKTCLITGVSGQMGSYQAELQLSKGHLVIGLYRRTSNFKSLDRVAHLLSHPRFKLLECDLLDQGCVSSIILQYKPDFVMNYAAQSHVASSFHNPGSTLDINVKGVLHLLEAIRYHHPAARFLQLSTSEIFGDNYTSVFGTDKMYQDEETAFHPRSPYAVSKLAAHYLVHTYRESYSLFACSAVQFNTESPRRGENFVTRKITRWIGDLIANIGLENIHRIREADKNNMLYCGYMIERPKLGLGNIDAYRDWSYVQDSISAHDLMINAAVPKDYVVSSDETHSVREFLELAFSYAGLGNYKKYIYIDEKYFRPAEVEYLCGKSSRIRQDLGWSPRYDFEDLVKLMVDYDVKEMQKYVHGEGGYKERPTNEGYGI